MIKISRTGVGVVTHAASLRDSEGTGLMPVQVDGDGATTFKINGRVATDAPWVEIKAAGVADILESISWVPFLQLEITAGAGTVTLWIGDK